MGDLDNFTLIRVKDRKEVDLLPWLTDLSFTKAIDGAPTYTASFTDPEWEILTAHHMAFHKAGVKDDEYIGFFDRNADDRLDAIDVTIDGSVYRLVTVSINGDSLELEFQNRNVVRLRNKYGRRVAKRSKETRAQFVRDLVYSIKATPIDFYSRELNVKQDVAKAQTSKDPGVPKHATIKIKGVKANPEQLRNIEVIMGVADKKNAPKLAVQAMLVAAIQESRILKGATDYATHTHKGVFQSNQIPPSDLEGQASHFLSGGKSFIAGGAIGLAKAHPDYSPGQIARMVEGSNGSDHDYQQWIKEANAILESWGGGKLNVTVTKAYQFKVTSNEDYWTAIQRLADEVQWRAFFHKDTFYFMDDYQLLRGRSQFLLRRSDSAIVTKPNFTWSDVGKVPQELTFDVLSSAFDADPGDVVSVTEAGIANGRWIVREVSGSYFGETVNVTLYQPQAPKKEPAPETTTRESGGSGSTGKVSIASNANRPGVPLQKPLMDFLKLVAGQTNEQIKVLFGSNHSQMTTSGNVSDHWTGNGADLDVGGRDTSKGDNIATAALIVCGYSHQRAHQMAVSGQLNFSQDFHWNGHRVQIGWRTTVGGDHHNHVHIGVK